jgi:hypothetical protein
MARLQQDGMEIDLPAGWEGRIFNRGAGPVAQRVPHEQFRPVLHAGNFALPAVVGDFGSGAVERMGRGHVFMALIDYGPEAAGTPLFAAAGPPRQLTIADFNPATLQRTLPGQSGSQRFFTVAGRGFCLYAVLSAHLLRARLVPVVNTAVRTLRIT